MTFLICKKDTKSLSRGSRAPKRPEVFNTGQFSCTNEQIQISEAYPFFLENETGLIGMLSSSLLLLKVHKARMA